MREEYTERKKISRNSKKKKTQKFNDEDLDAKKINKQFKQTKQRIDEDEEDWEHWDKYYNH